MNRDHSKRSPIRVNDVSDRLFGKASEMELVEAEELLKVRGMDPDAIVERVALGLKEKVRRPQRRRSLLLKRVLEELEPGAPDRQEEMKFDGKATQAIRKLLDDIKRLPELLASGKELKFEAAYRRKNKLSERDQELLESIRNALRTRFKKGAKDRDNGR